MKKGYWVIFEDFETGKDVRNGLLGVIKERELEVNGERVYAEIGF